MSFHVCLSTYPPTIWAKAIKIEWSRYNAYLFCKNEILPLFTVLILVYLIFVTKLVVTKPKMLFLWYSHLTNFLLEGFNLESLNTTQAVNESEWENISYIYILTNL